MYVAEDADLAGGYTRRLRVRVLASEAADVVTGHTMLVDGGWTAW